MIRGTVAVLVLVALSACSVITPKIGPKVAKAVNQYCNEPLAVRLANREMINAMIAPNHIALSCVLDEMTTPQ